MKYKFARDKKIIAIEFDNIIIKNNELYDINRMQANLSLIRFLINNKHKYSYILWTKRYGKSLKAAIDFCKGYYLYFDSVNKNLKSFNLSKKIIADYYIDENTINYKKLIKECEEKNNMQGNNLRDKREMTVEKVFVDWNEIEKFIDYLNTKLNLKEFTGVYGPARGGLVFATIISNRYNLPFLGAPHEGCLIVDDIVDSGVTAKTWQDKGYTIASMFYNHKSIMEPEVWYEEKEDRWIVFPWE